MKTMYVAHQRILLTSTTFYVEPGDILSFSTANQNTLTVYRKQKIVKTTPFTLGGLNAFVRAGMIHLYQATPAAAPPPAPPPAPVETRPPRVPRRRRDLELVES